MKRILVIGFALLAAGETLAYGVTRRRQRQHTPSVAQNSGYVNTQHYPLLTHSIRSSDVHQVHHDVHRTSSELPHSHITHHVTPVVRSHVHQGPPVEIIRTTKTLYQPPAVVHQTVDYEHHDHVTAHYPDSVKSTTHTDYFTGKQVNNVNTQAVSHKTPSSRKVAEVHHNDKFDTTVQQQQQHHHQQHQQKYHTQQQQQQHHTQQQQYHTQQQQQQQHHHHHHHDDHAHFGKVPTGNAVVTSYFNFPGSGRSDSKFQAPAPAQARKVDYLPQRSASPAYSPLQAQSIEDEDDQELSSILTPTTRPVYERINIENPQAVKASAPFYSGQASDTKSPSSVFPIPPVHRPVDVVFSPARYPKESFAERKRPEPLLLKENPANDEVKSSEESANEDSYPIRTEAFEDERPGALLNRSPETETLPLQQVSRSSRPAPLARKKTQGLNLQQQTFKMKSDASNSNGDTNSKQSQPTHENEREAEQVSRYSFEHDLPYRQRANFYP